MRRRIGEHADAADREHGLAGFVTAGLHRVGERAAQRGHVGFAIELRRVEDDEVRHRAVLRRVYRRVATLV
jgi:hypothetical protein